MLKKSIVWGLPTSYSIEPTSLCNLKCPECPTGKGLLIRKNIGIQPGVYASILEQISDTTCYLTLYLQGEPFLNPDIFELIQLADKKKIYTFTSTNGHFLNEENAERTVLSGLDRLIISLDGTTNQTYVQYRKGGSFEVVMAGIKNLVEAKQRLHSHTPYLILQFIVFKHNQHQISDFKLLAKSLGANKSVIKSAQLYDFEKGHERITDINKYARYKKTGENYVIKKKLRNRCKRLWSIGVVTVDGVLAPCCYDKNATFQMGNLTNNSLRQSWKSIEFNSFRHKILTNRKQFEICRNCNE